MVLLVHVSWLDLVKLYMWFCRMFETFLFIACATLSLSLVGFNSWRLYSQEPVADCFLPSPKQQRCGLVYFCPAGFHSLCISCVLLLLLMGLGAQLGSVFDLLLPLAMCAIALSFLLSIYLYIRSFWAPSHALALGGNTGEDVHLRHKNTPSVGFFFHLVKDSVIPLCTLKAQALHKPAGGISNTFILTDPSSTVKVISAQCGGRKLRTNCGCSQIVWR